MKRITDQEDGAELNILCAIVGHPPPFPQGTRKPFQENKVLRSGWENVHGRKTKQAPPPPSQLQLLPSKYNQESTLCTYCMANAGWESYISW